MNTNAVALYIGLKNPRFRVDFSQIRDYFQLSGVLPPVARPYCVVRGPHAGVAENPLP